MFPNHESRISLLESIFNGFKEKKKLNEIYFNVQIYDAYSKILDILKEAKKEDIIIIDKKTICNLGSSINYAGRKHFL